jgi:hypothetical protein
MRRREQRLKTPSTARSYSFWAPTLDAGLVNHPVSKAGLDHAFSYDGAGNPITFRGEIQDFSSNNQRVGSGFSHDSNGNPTTYKGTPLAFDPENRLTPYGTSMTASYRGYGLR